MRLLICAGGTGGGVYPALAVLNRLTAEHQDVQALWIGAEGGMEADLVTKAGVDFKAIPAAGVHGVGFQRLPGNLWQLSRGVGVARKILREFKPDVLFFTGGYVAAPMAVAGLAVPTVLYVPDIEPGMALKFLSFFADCIAVTIEDSKIYFPSKKQVIVTGYPVRPELSNWKLEDAYRIFDFSPDLPTLLVTGGSLGSLPINEALAGILPELLTEMQIIHLTGKLTWPRFENISRNLPEKLAVRYKSFPYLHDKMGAAFTIADLVISRAGASSIGEYPYFGIPAILAPYPYAWRYQKVNADYLARNHAAVILNDSDLTTRLLSVTRELINNPGSLKEMKTAMKSLSGRDAAGTIANLIYDMSVLGVQHRN